LPKNSVEVVRHIHLLKEKNMISTLPFRLP